jgi:hypothetical protein
MFGELSISRLVNESVELIVNRLWKHSLEGQIEASRL